MTADSQHDGDYKQILIEHWINKAWDDIESAQANFHSNRLANAVRDVYFACFHMVSALFMKEGKTFRKHSQVRSGFHREIIKPGEWTYPGDRFMSGCSTIVSRQTISRS